MIHSLIYLYSVLSTQYCVMYALRIMEIHPFPPLSGEKVTLFQSHTFMRILSTGVGYFGSLAENGAIFHKMRNLSKDKTRSQLLLHSLFPDHPEASLESSERETMGNAPSESKEEETTPLSDASLPMDNSFASSVSPNTSVASTQQMIQELAFGLEQEPSLDEQARLWFSQIEGSSSSSDEDDDPSSLYGTTAADSFLVGSFAGSAIPDMDSDDDLDANDTSWHSLASHENKKSLSINSIPTRRLAQHHLYLTGLCLASIRRRDEIGGPRGDFLSSDFENVIDESLGVQEGRPYPAE
jgi:hypothetical protein